MNQIDNKGGDLSVVDSLLEINRRHSQLFRSENSRGARRLYRETHPLEISAIKCMDGRLNLPFITNTALGIIQPWRNIGGRFNLGWTGFKDAMVNWYEYSIKQRRACLTIITYHYSRGDKHRGCAGFNYDTDAARASALALKNQFVRVFGNGPAFYPVLVGIETDLDALVLHGDDESKPPIDLAEVTDSSVGTLRAMLRELYPGMSAGILEDFLPLVQGNITHIAEIRSSNRPIADILHGEDTLAIGRGFDWLHEPNKAIIVGPFDPELRIPIATGARLLLGNLNDGRIPKEKGVVLITSASYRDRAGYDYPAACEKAKWLNEFSLRVIREEVPDLIPHLQQITAVMDLETRAMEVLQRS